MFQWAVVIDGRVVHCAERRSWRDLYAIARSYKTKPIYVKHRGCWKLVRQTS